ncbi:MAG: hypothetical protein IT566_16825 [Rhodospirillaceae bacterium]|nr:hypothetical protein [Rhodospirillaceae bacterium]
MNRRDRRAAAAQERTKDDQAPYDPSSSVRPFAPVVAAPASSGFLLRMFARIILSRWVIKRVKHPHVLTIMADLAGQAGRMDAMMHIQEKLRRHAG